MTSRIKLLPGILINKIAAGEVIERPASVVKELVENALDAESRSVRVEVSEGGLNRIAVTDDGYGMTPEELRLAIQRHATSKLQDPADLFNIRSFGFRGEALPSITSVSHFTIKSRTRDSDSGFQIEVEGGKLGTASDAGCDYGTTVVVRNLFFNTPARRKFLKTASAEVRRILEVMESLAIGNHDVEFVLESDGQRLLDLPPCETRIARAEQLFGISNAEKFVRGEKGDEHLQIEVFLAKPEICRRSRSRVMILVNNRRIESKSLFAAVTSAYGEFLPKGVYPHGVVFVTIRPDLVDVNVHPAKSEVRFADERSIFHHLYSLTRESLLGGEPVPTPTVAARDERQRQFTSGARQAIQSFFERKTGAGRVAEDALALLHGADTVGNAAAGKKSFAPSESTPPSVNVHHHSAVTEVREPLSRVTATETVVFQQIARLYIVAITPDAVFIIDQHAAHERVLYELALRSLATHSLTSQQLLLPIPIQLEPIDLDTYNRERESFSRLGFKLSDFGPRQIQIEAVPAVLGQRSPEKMFRLLLDDFCDLRGDQEKRYEKMAASFACRGAIMAGDRITPEAMRALFENLMSAENPYVCPHGRPTMLRLTKHDLDLKFGRLS